MQVVGKSFGELPRGRASVAIEHLDFLVRIIRREIEEQHLEVQIPVSDAMRAIRDKAVKNITVHLPLTAALQALHQALSSRVEEESQT